MSKNLLEEVELHIKHLREEADKHGLFLIRQIDEQNSINFQTYAHGLAAALNFTKSLIKLHKYDKTKYRYEIYHMYEDIDEHGLPMFWTPGMIDNKKIQELYE